MKKFLFGLILVCIMLVSCKKDHSKDHGTSTTTHKVAFNVGFSKSTGAFETSNLKTNGLKENAADTALTNHADVLYFAVYDSNGGNITTVKQLSTDPGFGSYTDNLASGTYFLVVAAGGNNLIVSGDKAKYVDVPRKLSTDVLAYGFDEDINNGYLSWHPFTDDTFYKKITLNVTNTDINQSISLDRITSKLVVNIEDALPANAKTMYVLTNPSDKFYIGSGTGSISEGNNEIISPVSAAQIGTTNFKLAQLFLTSAPFSVNVYCSSLPPPPPYTNIPNIIANKNISNVTGQPNKVTLLSGSLFGGTTTHSTGGFTVSVDTTWNAIPITKSF
ncbi:hypothetical protein [Mucilaginibacter sp. OK098]|uniref:hypothetical protein n=1 Tax=Mucilaginibacter sp. OK098 TaxID=1855297 RepID=UPI0009210375|nr:hypothetical protein [Mucilaginibacter sp. OK098]SHM17693.1 hypothetical protein SAMN05216524_1011061 [Mucilaginibacter sp. OK098]